MSLLSNNSFFNNFARTSSFVSGRRWSFFYDSLLFFESNVKHITKKTGDLSLYGSDNLTKDLFKDKDEDYSQNLPYTLISGMSHDASQSSQYTCRAPPSGGWSGGWGSLSSRQLRKRAGPVNAGFAEGDDAGQIRQRVWPIKGESAM